MKIQSPSALTISFKDIGEFTHGIADMDLSDITGIGYAIPSLTTAGDQKITTEPAQLDDATNFINNPGSYVYRLDLTLDSEKLDEAEVDGILLDIFSEEPTTSYADDFDDINNIINKSKVISSNVGNSNQQRLQVTIDYRSDLFSAKKNSGIGEDLQGFSVDVLSDKPLKNVPASLQKPVKTAALQQQDLIDTDDLTIKKMVSQNFLAGLDPFASLKSSESLTSAESMISLSDSDTADFEEDVVLIKNTNFLNEVSLKKLRKSLLESYKSLSGNSAADQETKQILELLKEKPQQLGSVNLGYVSRISTNKFRVVRDIEIPKSLIGQKQSFYVRIKPIMKSFGTTGTTLEPVHFQFKVNHRSQVQEMMDPVVPPTVKVLQNTPNKIVLRLTDSDPTTRSIKITRRIFDPRLRRLIKTQSFTTENDVITDLGVDNIAPNKVYYTTSAINNDGVSGPSASIVVDGLVMPNIQAKDEDVTPTIHATNMKEGIEVCVENIPPEMSFIRVIKEKQSVPGDLKSRRSALTDSTGSSNLLVDARKKIRFFDRDVADNHSYRYYMVLQSGIGNGYIAEDDDVITRKYPRYELPYNIVVGEPQQVNGAVNTTVKIDLLATQKKESFEFFIELLANSGADKFFLDEIKKQRNSFSDVIAFLIERIDTSTGKKVSLGIHRPGTFYDVGSASNLGSIKPGKKYIYKVKVCIKPIEAFFKNLFSSLTNPKQTSGTEVTKFLSKKFLDSANRHLGVIPSDFEIRQSVDPSSQLRASETGLTYAKTLRTGLARAKVHRFRRVQSPRRNPDAVKLSFSISGNLKAVLKAIVLCDTRSGQTILDELTVNPGVNDYYFIDNRRFNEVGTKTYKIVLLYTDFVESPPSNEIVVKKESNIVRSMQRIAGTKRGRR